MRAFVLLLIVVAGASTALAQEADPYVVVFDQYMSPAAGAQDLLTLQHELAAVEDRWIPLKLGQERSRPSYALGILYRGTKFLMFDVPQDHFLMVVAHEVFGHGARFRELGEGTLTYGFDAPIPYGSGTRLRSSSDSFQFPRLPISTYLPQASKRSTRLRTASPTGRSPAGGCTTVKRGSISSRGWPP